MDRKRNIIIISSLIILFFLVALINLFYVNKSQEVYENEKSNNYISENILTMMYETAEGSGEYVVASDTTWPQDGYTFNEQLSSCENGGTLTWDDENKRVIMQTNTSDKWHSKAWIKLKVPVIRKILVLMRKFPFYGKKQSKILPKQYKCGSIYGARSKLFHAKKCCD